MNRSFGNMPSVTFAWRIVRAMSASLVTVSVVDRADVATCTRMHNDRANSNIVMAQRAYRARLVHWLPMPDLYEIDAEFYDLIHDDHNDDTGLWLSFAGRTDLPVLEIGTGSGRIALELARRGHRVVGIDPSNAMLSLARQAAEEEAVDVSFIEGGSLDLALEQDHYGLIIIPADVFLYCSDGHEQIATLGALGKALAFNGVLAVDLPGPAQWLDDTTNGQPLLVFSGELEDGTHLDTWHVHEDDLAYQVRTLRVMYDLLGSDGILRRRQSEHLLRYVYRFEIEYLLKFADLALTDVYGDYELGPLTNESERMIVIARRTSG